MPRAAVGKEEQELNPPLQTASTGEIDRNVESDIIAGRSVWGRVANEGERDMKRIHSHFVTTLACVLLLAGSVGRAATSALKLGLKPDGKSDCTEALQQALNGGKTEVHFPRGTYRLGTVTLPARTHLAFAPGASVSINRERTGKRTIKSTVGERRRRVLFVADGDHISVRGLQTGSSVPVGILIYAENVSGLRCSGLSVKLEKSRGISAVYAWKSSDIELTDSRFENIGNGIHTEYCADVSVHGNRAVNCETITEFERGSRYLRHYDNWSRGVTYQCVFRGGSPDPSRKPPRRVPPGSSTIVRRNLRPGDEGWQRELSGNYDVQIKNNYAEYGRTLAWGNKARQVIFEGNISRYMNDYSYGVEGSENVVFANNISINARSAGIMSMYWGSKLLITGNIVIVRDEPYVQEYSDFKNQKAYHGGLMRFHHGPTKKADTEAGSRYGAGKAVITGNLCVNGLSDRVRRIKAAGGRDVLVENNKIVNGSIWKWGESELVVRGNEIISHMPYEHMAVMAHTPRNIVVDNTIRREKPYLEMPDGKDRPDPRAACRIKHRTREGQLHVFEGNQIEGWTTAAGLTAGGDEATVARVIVRDNMADGALVMEGTAGSYELAADGNLQLDALEPLQVKKKPKDR